ncbi:hypothetical protein EMIHUDRAFT_467315, partial [Emiliania huxleyi CCMP1516]
AAAQPKAPPLAKAWREAGSVPAESRRLARSLPRDSRAAAPPRPSAAGQAAETGDADCAPARCGARHSRGCARHVVAAADCHLQPLCVRRHGQWASVADAAAVLPLRSPWPAKHVRDGLHLCQPSVGLQACVRHAQRRGADLRLAPQAVHGPRLGHALGRRPPARRPPDAHSAARLDHLPVHDRLVPPRRLRRRRGAGVEAHRRAGQRHHALARHQPGILLLPVVVPHRAAAARPVGLLPEPDDGGELAADVRRRYPRRAAAEAGDVWHTALLAALPAHHLRPALQERLVVRLHAGGHVARVRAHVCDRHRGDPRDHGARLRGSHLRRRHHVHEPGDERGQRHQQPPPRRLAVQHEQRRAQGVRPWTRTAKRVGGRRVVRGGAVEHGVAHAARHRHRLPLAPLPAPDAEPKGGGAPARGAAPQPRRRLGDACAARLPRHLRHGAPSRHDPRRAANLPADGLPRDRRRKGVLGPRC